MASRRLLAAWMLEKCFFFSVFLYVVRMVWCRYRGGQYSEDRRERRERQMIEWQLKQATPRLQDHWTDAQKADYLRQWNVDFVAREEAARRGRLIPNYRR